MRSQDERFFAKFLDDLEIEWEYEPQRYYLANGEGYDPDFWCPKIGVFFEVKGVITVERLHKPWIFAHQLAHGSLDWDWHDHELDGWFPRVYLSARGWLYEPRSTGWVRGRLVWARCYDCGAAYPVSDSDVWACRSCQHWEKPEWLGYAQPKQPMGTKRKRNAIDLWRPSAEDRDHAGV